MAPSTRTEQGFPGSPRAGGQSPAAPARSASPGPRTRRPAVLCAAALLAMSPLSARGEEGVAGTDRGAREPAGSPPLELRFHSIDGGGGRSTGGVYELTGAFGQPDTRAAAGATYTVLGGLLVAGSVAGGSNLVFADGFESGDTNLWSTVNAP